MIFVSTFNHNHIIDGRGAISYTHRMCIALVHAMPSLMAVPIDTIFWFFLHNLHHHMCYAAEGSIALPGRCISDLTLSFCEWGTQGITYWQNPYISSMEKQTRIALRVAYFYTKILMMFGSDLPQHLIIVNCSSRQAWDPKLSKKNLRKSDLPTTKTHSQSGNCW